MEAKRNNVLLDTSVSSCNSLYFCTDESDVGSFIGDNMTSDSASFEGFDMGLASSELVAPSGSIVKNKIYENKTSEVTTVTDSGANLPSFQQIVSNEFNVVDNSSTKDESPISTRVSVSSENIRNDILEQSNINQTSATANFNRVETEHGSEATLFVNNSEVVNIGHSNLISIPQNEYFPKQNGKYENKKGLEVGKQNTNMDYQYSPTLSRDQNNDLGYEIIATGKSSECNFSSKKVVSNADFKVDFGVLKDIPTCHPFLDIPQVDSKKNSHEVVPPSMLALHVNNSTDTQTENLTPKQTDRDLTNTMTDNMTDIQTGKTQFQTDMTVDRQTENLNISVMFDMLFKKIEIVNNKLTEQKETSFNVSKQVIGAVTNVEDQLVELGTDVKHKLDGLDHKFTTLQNDFEQCKVEIISLKSDVAQNAHQIEFISTQVKENTKMINEVKEGSDKIELHLAEKLLSCSLNLDRKNDVVKEEVNQNKMLVGKMSIDLQQAREELDDLKSNCHRLEGAINQNRDQSNLLNNQLTGLAQNMICGSTKDPMLIESLLHQLSPQSVTKMDNHKTSATPQPVVYKVDTLPSISSTPVVSPNFCAPQTIVNQPYANQYPLSYSPRHVSEEEAIMKDIRKREKTPSFDGTSTSAPQFILEAEAYFTTVNITNDYNKVRVLGSFLKDVALQWWKRVVKDISTWEEAKTELMEQYFNDYNRMKFKLEWKEYEYEKVKDVEKFALQAFHLLDIVKPKYSFKKKCQTVASRLPALLMSYLIQKDFSSEKDFMNILKEAMILTNFKQDSSPPKINSTNSNNSNNTSNSYNNGSSNNNLNNTNNNQNNGNNFNNNNSNKIITNPNYKGKPSNFDPNYKTKMYQGNNYNRWNNNNGNNNYNGLNNQQGNNSNNGRTWYNGRGNHNNGRQNQRPYNNIQRRNGNGNNNPLGVNNVAVVPAATTPTSSPVTTTQASDPLSAAMVHTSDVVTLPTTLFQHLLQARIVVSPPVSPDGQKLTDPDPSN